MRFRGLLFGLIDPWGYGGGIGIGGILLIVLIVYLLFGRGGL